MANLYNKAGLINIPVGYSDGFLYNIKPTDNTLGFRFNRDSAATRVNKEGLIEQVGYFGPELVTNGNFATDSDWTKGTGWSIANGRASYDGTGGTSFIRQNDVIEVGKTYKVTLEVLANEGSGINTIFLGGTVLNSSHLSVGSYTFYGSTNNTDVSLYIYGRSGEVFEIDNVSVKEVLGDKPRIDYTDSLTSPSFLLEPQRTNLVTYSKDFSQWTPTNIVLTKNTVTSPDGTITADKIVGTTVTSQHRVNFTSTNVSGATTFSFFAKSAEYTSCWARIGLSSAFFDLENGVSNQGLGITSSIKNFGNGWYRCIMTKASSSANEVCRINITTSYTDSSDFLGDGTSGIYLWGAQHEQGSYATSYIPTSGSTATRAQETCTGAGSASTFNSTEGVLYAEIAALADDETFRFISISDGTTANRVFIGYQNTSNNFYVLAGTAVAFISHTITDITKIAVKYKSGDTSIFINGIEAAVKTDTYTLNGLNSLQFDSGGGGSKFYGKIKSVAVFKEALTDDELQQLTGPEYNSFAALAAAYNYTVI